MIKQALSFVAVVQAGSYSAAAKNIEISKAQLSRHIVQLEEELEVSLLFRTTRTLKLTESGEAFFKSCLPIQEDYQNAINNLKQNFESIKGTLRITAPIAFGSEKLTLLLDAFAKLYPNIKVILSLSSLSENLMDDKYDIAIRIAGALPDSDLKVRKLLAFKSILCASPKMFNNKALPTSLESLEQLPCITSINRGHSLNVYWPFLLNNKVRKIKINASMEIDNQRAQISLAKSGRGIVRVFRSFVEEDIKTAQLIEVLPEFLQPDMHAYLLYPNRKWLPKKIELFKDFILNNVNLLS